MHFKKIHLLIIFTLLLSGFLLANISQAGTFDEIMKGFSKTGESGGYPVQNQAPKQEFAAAWINYVNGILVMMGLLFMIFILYSGWLWMSARGNEEQVAKAKNQITNTLIALAIIIGARLIVEITLRVLGSTLPGTG